MSYKVGDKVRVLDYETLLSIKSSALDDDDGFYVGDMYFNNFMRIYCGQVFTIASINDRDKNEIHYYLCDENGNDLTRPESYVRWVFVEEMLESTEPQFKVGDMVTIRSWPEIVALSDSPDKDPGDIDCCVVEGVYIGHFMRGMCGGTYKVLSVRETIQHAKVYELKDPSEESTWLFPVSILLSADTTVLHAATPALSFQDLFAKEMSV